MLNQVRIATITHLRRFARDEGGATAIEYALVASCIGVAAAGAIASLGTNVKGLYTKVLTAMK
ncbi:MAG TPA: Flp family type IVb pilin [Xanthobacteraceae bacterium]|nr:Flp family type IVb pilin [Xanthobacteraceae bacterium]